MARCRSSKPCVYIISAGRSGLRIRYWHDCHEGFEICNIYVSLFVKKVIGLAFILFETDNRRNIFYFSNTPWYNNHEIRDLN